MFVHFRSLLSKKMGFIILYGVLIWFFGLFLLIGLIRIKGIEYGLYGVGDILLPRHPVFAIYLIDAAIYFLIGVLIQILFKSNGNIISITTWVIEASFQFFFVGVYFNWNAPVTFWISGSLLNVLSSMFLIAGTYSMYHSRKWLELR